MTLNPAAPHPGGSIERHTAGSENRKPKTMKIIDYIEGHCPNYALSYLVNGDASGIEDEDVANCDEWLKSLSDKMARDYPGFSTGLIFDDDAEPSFRRYPAFSLACDCIPCAFVVWAENESPLQRIALPWEEENEED